jgi:ribosome-binding protein aMBF1 (putative translation factor)
LRLLYRVRRLIGPHSRQHVRILPTRAELVKNPRSVRRDEGASEMGRRVRQLRIAAGLTQTALAKRSGMDRTHLSRLERGRLMPTFPTLKRLAKTLQVTPRSFL